jgi:hypothetical protein
MSDWKELAERLVEVDLRIEDLDSWATEPESVAALKRLEDLRDEMQAAIAHHRMPRRLRGWLHDGQGHRLTLATIDPRD